MNWKGNRWRQQNYKTLEAYGWQRTVWNLPLKQLKIHTTAFSFVQEKAHAVKNTYKGQISGFNAILFDLIIYEENHGLAGRNVSSYRTWLLVDASPNHVLRFWISEHTWADNWLRKQGLIGGIQAQEFDIGGPDEEAIRKVFQPDLIAHYTQERKYKVEGGGTFVLVGPGEPGNKEIFFDIIAEGKFILKILKEREGIFKHKL